MLAMRHATRKRERERERGANEKHSEEEDEEEREERKKRSVRGWNRGESRYLEGEDRGDTVPCFIYLIASPTVIERCRPASSSFLLPPIGSPITSLFLH